MRKRTTLLGLVLLAGGCASAPSPASSPADDLTRYLPDENQLRAAGAKQKQAPSSFALKWITPLHVVAPCKGEMPWESALRNNTQASASAGELDVWQLAAVYQGYSGEQMVAVLDKALGCGENASSTTRFSVPGLADRQLGFCRRFREPRLSSCVVVLARGDRLLAVRIGSTSAEAPPLRAKLRQLAPTFAAAFDKD
ncbi:MULTISPECIES: hypothetical protein [Amycolatopsis]|uniref:DUF3558 domain-containing protein n=1 Tax=Amycolatopsis dendrobii TaxID=2760662 RepID=A0A7W3VRR9_9PSEU|nr:MULTISPECIES: hypothetical protein [Amycolatopsis]MBB1152016.1 hypothetical protein [Amycolatopsis dendrobii]UKD57778.1 hypothetical protein L3Q65_13975 [Amycolatopsis sp. FU40]